MDEPASERATPGELEPEQTPGARPATEREEESTATSDSGSLFGRFSLFLVGGLALFALAVVTTPRGETSQAQLERGVAAYEAGRVDQAREIYEEVLVRDPANVIAHFNLGVAEQEAEKNAQAEEHYRLALKSNPEFAPALFNLAILLEASGRPEESAEMYRRLLDSHPNEAAAHINLGYLYINKLGRRADGEAHFRRALEIDPNLVSRVPDNIRPAVQEPAVPSSESPANPPPA